MHERLEVKQLSKDIVNERCFLFAFYAYTFLIFFLVHKKQAYFFLMAEQYQQIYFSLYNDKHFNSIK